MKTIVFILSTNYSGSHLLSLLIGSHSRFQHIGEVRGLGKARINPDRQYCGLCGGHYNCPVLGGITAENIDQIYEIIFSNVGRDVSGLVDTSKKTDWAQRFLKDNRYDKKFLFLVRDPRSLIRRWSSDKNLNHFRERLKLIKYPPRQIKIGLTGNMNDVFLGKWLQQNNKIYEFIENNKLDSFVITYHDLVVDQLKSLSNIMDWLGEKYESGQEEYWNFTHHGSEKYQYKDKRTIELDCRWKDYLSAEQKNKISNNRDVAYFLEKCGLAMGDDGLMQKK